VGTFGPARSVCVSEQTGASHLKREFASVRRRPGRFGFGGDDGGVAQQVAVLAGKHTTGRPHTSPPVVIYAAAVEREQKTNSDRHTCEVEITPSESFAVIVLPTGRRRRWRESLGRLADAHTRAPRTSRLICKTATDKSVGRIASRDEWPTRRRDSAGLSIRGGRGPKSRRRPL
jgi:hypothetical protein